VSRVPFWIACLAAIILPARLREWGRAMVVETKGIEQTGAALSYALGCLRTALSHLLPFRPAEKESSMPFSTTGHPRRLGAFCATGAVMLGIGYMAAAGAPASYLAMNGAALLLGLLALGVMGSAEELGRMPRGLVVIVLAGLLLFVSLWGVSAGGVTRWVAVGGVLLQPSLLLVPVLVLNFVRSPNIGSAFGILVMALALALAPDRAMTAALLAGLVAFALLRRGRIALAAMIAAALGFTAAVVRDDPSPAMPFVDQIFFSAFRVHPIAGLALVAGAALMLVPAILGFVRDPANRPTYAAFGAVWLTVIVAAALGNYPTPLVGYGGSAILGYFISLSGLPKRTAGTESVRGSARAPQPPGSDLTPRISLG
jgi:hypothetical protein